MTHSGSVSMETVRVGGAGMHDELRTLAELAGDLAGEFRLQPLLERILSNAIQLLGCESGSICTIDEPARVYRKEVDLGIGCRSGEVFPIDEGVTGAVVRAGRAVTFARYSDVPGGHIPEDDPRYTHPVIGIPIRVKSTMVGACVVFGREPHTGFADDDVRLLELFATHAAVAIANSRLHTAASERAQTITIAAERERALRELHDTVGRSVASVLLDIDRTAETMPVGGEWGRSLSRAREAAEEALSATEGAVRGLGPPVLERTSIEEAISLELDWAAASSDATTSLLVIGQRRPIAGDVTHQLNRIVQETLSNAVSHSAATSIRLGLVYGDDGVGLIVEDDGRGFDTSPTPPPVGRSGGLGLGGLVARAQQVGGVARIESTLGWGTRIRVDLPYSVPTTVDELATRWRVLVIHDQPVTRSGLVRLLGQAEPGVQIVGELADPAHVAEAVRLLRPDVVLSDVDLPGSSGADLVGAVTAADPDVSVVLLAGSRADDRVWRAARAGARGFVDRTVDAVGLGRAILSAVSGDVLVPADLIDSLGGWESPDPLLTAREAQVRELVERGWQDKEIATRLGIAVKTVEKHVGAILRKTGARNRTMLAALAQR